MLDCSPSARVRVSDSEDLSESKQLLVAKKHPNVVDYRKIATQFLEQFLNEQHDIFFLGHMKREYSMHESIVSEEE
jgi:hypothetical protein